MINRDFVEVIPLSKRFNSESPDIRESRKLSPGEQDFVDIQKRRTYNEAETLFMQFENGSAKEGTLKVLYRTIYKQWVLYEKTADGVVEIVRDKSFKKVRDVYDRLYDGANGSFDRDFERVRDRERADGGDLQSDRDGERDIRDSGQAIPGEVRGDTGGSGTDSSGGNSGLSSPESRKLTPTEQLTLENEQLRAANAALQQEFKLTQGHHISEKALGLMAGRLLKNTGSTMQKTELQSRLRALFDYIGNTSELVWEDVQSATYSWRRSGI